MDQVDRARQQLNWWCSRAPLKQGYTRRNQRDAKETLAGFLQCFVKRNPLPPDK